MIVKDVNGRDIAISPKSAFYGKGWGGGVYFRTKSGKWRFGGGATMDHIIDVPKEDVNPDNKLPWGVNPDTIVEVEA